VLLTVVALAAYLGMPDQIQPDCNNLSTIPILNVWSHWDAKWYLQIAQHGYQFIAGEQCNAAFAPLYPMLMRAIGLCLGGSTSAYLIAGLIISNTALWIGLTFVYRFAEEQFDHAVARRAVLYILICPGTLFLSAVYPMSLFLAIAAAGLYYARHGRWALAIAIASLAPLARPDGALLIVPLAFELGRQFGIRRLWILLPVVAASYLWPAYQWLQFGDAFAFIKAQSAWHPSPFWTVFHSQRALLFLGTTFVFIVLTIASWFTLRPSLAAYASTFLLMMLSAARFWSIVRFLVILFPAFIVLGLAGRSKLVHIVFTVVSSVIAGCLMVRFALGFWVA
jgi:Gpi18-like mannosyltransferase